VRETTDTICEWAVATFGEVPDLTRLLIRAGKESYELLDAVTAAEYDPAKIAAEAADVAIPLVRTGRILGVDLLADARRYPAAGSLQLHAIHANRCLAAALQWREDSTERLVAELRILFRHLSSIATETTGGSLLDAIDAKMAVNRTRTWSRRDGVGYHIHEEAP
jgi:NTP pyrophosphatase (non-canonical NTP hydrolase)